MGFIHTSLLIRQLLYMLTSTHTLTAHDELRYFFFTLSPHSFLECQCSNECQVFMTNQRITDLGASDSST